MKKHCGFNAYWLYVVRRRDDGAAIYCGVTNDVDERRIGHAYKGVLSTIDPDEYEVLPVVQFICDWPTALVHERVLTEHLLAQGARLLNTNVGSRQGWRDRPFMVIDLIDRDGAVAACVVSQSGLTPGAVVSLIQGTKKRHPTWLPAKVEQYRAAFVADADTHDEAFLAMVDHWAAVRRGEPVDTYMHIVDPWPSEDERALRVADRERRRRMTKHLQAERFVQCVETGDLFSTIADAAAWARCTECNVRRAARGSARCAAGGLHWRILRRDDLTQPQLAAVHLPASERAARGLPAEHVPAEVVGKRVEPVKWVVDGEERRREELQLTTAYANHRFVCAAVDLETNVAAVVVNDTLGGAWRAVVHLKGFMEDHPHELHAHLVNRTAVDKYSSAVREELRQAGITVRAARVNTHQTAWKVAATKAERAAKYVVNVHDQRVFASAGALARYLGIGTSQVISALDSNTGWVAADWGWIDRGTLSAAQWASIAEQIEQMRTCTVPMSDVKPTVVVDRPKDRRVVVYAQTKRKVSPREWIVNGEHLPSTTVFDVKRLCDDQHRYIAVVECTRGVEVAVGRDLGHMWSTFVSKYGAVDGECIVTADLVECTDRGRANALRDERLGELRALGKRILADKFIRRGGNVAARARNTRMAWICVDTGEVFASVRQAADAHGLTDRQVFGAVRYHTGRAGGLTWREVPVDGLDAAGQAEWEAALTRLAGGEQG